MPRVSREQTEANREAITNASARLFKERGFSGVSVADLMAVAGLTHGGFYGHFESKEALAVAACARAFEESADRWRRQLATTASPEETRDALVRNYLMPQTRADQANACPTASFAGDVAREPLDAPLREVYASGVGELLAILEALQHSGSSEADRATALADFSTMVGAMVLSRATKGSGLSDEFLRAARARLGVAGQAEKLGLSRTRRAAKPRA